MDGTGIVGVVLAGGQSRRMGGGDKSLSVLGGRAILSHVIERLSPQVRLSAISANGDPARFDAWGLTVLADAPPAYRGPLAGLLSGLDWGASVGAGHVATVAADTPFFPLDLVSRLAAGGRPIAMAATPGSGRHPTFGLWPVALRESLRLALDRGVRRPGDWAEGQGLAVVGFEDAGDPFFNINTPEDLETARRRLAAP